MNLARRLLTIGSALTLFACASRPMVAPQSLAPALRSALDGSQPGPRIYRGTEVRYPVVRTAAAGPPRVEWNAPDGSATIRFLVDSTGHIEPGTVEFVSGLPELAAMLNASLPDQRFYPAKLADGRYVRQLTEITLTKHSTEATFLLSTDTLGTAAGADAAKHW